MGLLLKLKAYAWAIGAALLAALAFIGRLKTLEHQRDKARQRANVAEAKVHINKVEKEIKKKEEKKLSSSLEEVERKIKEGKVEELDNLINPNDNW